MSVIDLFDTSAILNMPSLINHGGVVPRTVITELEEIKNSSTRDGDIKAAARKVSRTLFENKDITTLFYSQKEVESVWRKFSWLPRNNDGTILAEAYLTQKKTGNQVIVFTADYNMYLAAKQLGLDVKWCAKDNETAKEPWTGWRDFILTDENMASLYANPSLNILGAKVNEYCKIYSAGHSDLKDVLRWDGEKFCKLKYKPITSAVGNKWSPLNIEQKMLFDLLQNDDIPVKLALGNYGSGKSSLMLAHALEAIQRGKYDKIVFIRNNVEVKDTIPLGALPNDEISKLMPFLMPIVDHVGIFAFEEMIQQNVIEPVHLGFIRGRDLRNCVIFCDESENLTAHQVQLIIGRIGKGSALYMAGDLRQTDKLSFEKNSGVVKMINCLSNNPLFGMVKLQQSVRSEVCKLADLMD